MNTDYKDAQPALRERQRRLGCEAMAKDVRNCRVRVHQRTCGLQNRGTRSVEFVVSMQEEQNVEGFLQHWVRDVVFFSHMVHHEQETCGAVLTPQRNQRMTRSSRSGVAEMGRRGNKFSPLANPVRHAGVALVSNGTVHVGCRRALTQQGLSLYQSVGIFACRSSPKILYLLWCITSGLMRCSVRWTP